MPSPNPPRRRALAAAVLLAVTYGLPAVAQTTAPSKTPITMEEARRLVLALPEVRAWQAEREREARANRNAPAAGGILTAVRAPKGRKGTHYAITFYKTPATAPEKWNVFYVRASDGKILVEDATGAALTVEQWRKRASKPAG